MYFLRKTILITIFGLISSFGFSQNLIDSLKTTLDSDSPIEVKLAAIKKVANQLAYSHPDTMVYFSKYLSRIF